MIYDRDYMRDPQPNRWLEVLRTDAVTTLVILNVIVFLAQRLGIGAEMRGGDIHLDGALSIASLREGRVWTIVTHMFVHGTVFHLLGNCLMIFFVGKSLQTLVGPRHFLNIYFLSGLAGAALQLSIGWLAKDMHPMIGASGCAFGVFLALAVMLPQEMVTALMMFIIPLKMRLWNMAMLFLGVSVVLGLLEVFKVFNLGIAHFAHVGGALAGWWYVRMLGYGGAPVTYERLWHERQERELQRELAVVPKKRFGASSKKQATDAEPIKTKDFIAREIDPILEKIACHGIASLTEPERRLLEQARSLLKTADSETGKRD
jgi:membrane associated rhomboid family serine protease